jgi:hypothetical protein
MSQRIQDADFDVSSSTLEVLAAWAFMQDTPHAIDSDQSSVYHAGALDSLRKYVRLLGNSLPKKDARAREGSVNTYLNFESQDYCEGQPLIPADEAAAVLRSIGTRK